MRNRIFGALVGLALLWTGVLFYGANSASPAMAVKTGQVIVQQGFTQIGLASEVEAASANANTTGQSPTAADPQPPAAADTQPVDHTFWYLS
ncbi:MAG: hypothetical protein Q7O66_04715 [Dehalococcoidia bacterium]|nr:hypothetical protein [Dehalococcoidia bacterium]